MSERQGPADRIDLRYFGEPVVSGEEYMELDGDFYHQECFEGSAVDILLEKFGAQKGIAKRQSH